MTEPRAPSRETMTRLLSAETDSLMNTESMSAVPMVSWIAFVLPDGDRTSIEPAMYDLLHSIVPSSRTPYPMQDGDTSVTRWPSRSSFARGKRYSRNGPAPPSPVACFDMKMPPAFQAKGA